MGGLGRRGRAVAVIFDRGDVLFEADARGGSKRAIALCVLRRGMDDAYGRK